MSSLLFVLPSGMCGGISVNVHNSSGLLLRVTCKRKQIDILSMTSFRYTRYDVALQTLAPDMLVVRMSIFLQRVEENRVICLFFFGFGFFAVFLFLLRAASSTRNAPSLRVV